ncbi:MAG: hypothetical protein ACP5JR_00515 [Thermoplasmata archaeon]
MRYRWQKGAFGSGIIILISALTGMAIILFVLFLFLVLILVMEITEPTPANEVSRMETFRYMQSYHYMLFEPPEERNPPTLKVFARKGNNIWNLFFAGRNARGEYCLHYIGPKFISFVNATPQEIKEAQREKPNFIKLREYSRRTKLPCLVIPRNLIEKGSPVVPAPGIFKNAEFIDLKKYAKNLYFIPFLLEPERAYVLDEFKKELPGKHDVILFTCTRPWIVILAFEP